MTDQLRVLVALGLGLLLLLLRLDAERFGAAEYDEADTRIPPSVRRRLAWYVLGIAIIAAVLLIYPRSAHRLPLGFGDRLGTVVIGFTYGALGAAQAFAFASLRYRRLRLPDPASYPGALVNAIVTAFVDEAAFRGILLGFLLSTGLEPWVAVVVQALVYTLCTRTGATGRAPYMFWLSLGIGLLGGWATAATGGIGAAFLGHAITRFAMFLVTGHAGQVAPRGAEIEEVLRRRLLPDGWRIVGSRDTEAASRDQ
ncbi:MAG TPA: CPBP family glutamic-type intramembrane protease [Candidatus Dormibacteraeota bacterium]|nr:CPBP family glutamic-type intramembrane protease [Candidatus Dormibacteraeota bacterium]